MNVAMTKCRALVGMTGRLATSGSTWLSLVLLATLAQIEARAQDSSGIPGLGGGIDVEAQEVHVGQSKFISDGGMLRLVERGFTISPPPGWEVHADNRGVTLLMQIPYREDIKYQRSIQVSRFREPMPIDETTGRQFEKEIERRFSKSGTGVQDFRMRDHMMTELKDGSPAILFYSELAIGGKNIMQAHVLTSSATHHFVMTYTDLAEHFEGEAAVKFFTPAWESMTSIRLDSKPPVRFETIVVAGMAIVAMLALLLVIFVLRKLLSGSSYSKMAREDEESRTDTPGHEFSAGEEGSLSGRGDISIESYVPTEGDEDTGWRVDDFGSEDDSFDDLSDDDEKAG